MRRSAPWRAAYSKCGALARSGREEFVAAFASVEAIDANAATKPGREFLGGFVFRTRPRDLKNAASMKRCWRGRHHLLSCKMRVVRMPLLRVSARLEVDPSQSRSSRAKAIRTARILFGRAARVAGGLNRAEACLWQALLSVKMRTLLCALPSPLSPGLGLLDQFRGGVDRVGDFLYLLGRQCAL